ncbi:MAG: LAGLIDADG family homing endonuclease [Elusimicrobiota bacterium]
MEPNKFTKKEAGIYIAAFIDGEGSIDRRGNKITIYNSNPAILEFINGLIEILTGYKGRVHQYATPKGKKNFFHLYVTHRMRLFPLLKNILPFLIDKKEVGENVHKLLLNRKNYNSKPSNKK